MLNGMIYGFPYRGSKQQIIKFSPKGKTIINVGDTFKEIQGLYMCV